jgi:hypothetical protein
LNWKYPIFQEEQTNETEMPEQVFPRVFPVVMNGFSEFGGRSLPRTILRTECLLSSWYSPSWLIRSSQFKRTADLSSSQRLPPIFKKHDLMGGPSRPWCDPHVPLDSSITEKGSKHESCRRPAAHGNNWGISGAWTGDHNLRESDAGWEIEIPRKAFR